VAVSATANAAVSSSQIASALASSSSGEAVAVPERRARAMSKPH
jgi:hypothetical protein